MKYLNSIQKKNKSKYKKNRIRKTNYSLLKIEKDFKELKEKEIRIQKAKRFKELN